MLYRKMPQTGDEISILGYGCMRLPLNAEGGIDEARAAALIRSSIDKGVNYIDTAWPYHGGESEPVVGWYLNNRHWTDSILNGSYRIERLGLKRDEL